VQRRYCYIIFIGQQGVKFDQGGVGMFVNESSNFLFVGSQFQFGTGLILFRLDGIVFASLFEDCIDGCAADGVLCNDVFDECAFVIGVHDSFSQVDRISFGHEIPP